MTVSTIWGIRTIVSVTLWSVGLLLMWRLVFPRRRATSDPGPLPDERLSVIIPARNEAHQIGRLLTSLADQRTRPMEIVVVDDNSSDGTSEVACAHGARVVVGAPLPEGWNGKSWACWQGAQSAQGDLLLFLDADTWFVGSDGLAALLRRYPEDGLLALQPCHVTHKGYEQFSALFNIVLMAAMGAFTIAGDRLKPGGAFGPCMLCRREDYFAVGGHRQVGGEVLEDIPLGRLFVQRGLPVRCRAGTGIIHFRMYPSGWRELIEGWTKGMGYGAVSVSSWASLMAGAWITGCFGAITGLVAPVALQGVVSVAGVALYAAYALLIWLVLKNIGHFRWWTAAAYPFPLTFFAVIVVRSFILTYSRKRVRWKGRSIRTDRQTKSP